MALTLFASRALAGGGGGGGSSAALTKLLDHSDPNVAATRFNETISLVSNDATYSMNTNSKNKLSMEVVLKANDMDRSKHEMHGSL